MCIRIFFQEKSHLMTQEQNNTNLTTSKENETEWVKEFPYAQMAKKFGLKPTRKKDEKLSELLQFFNINSYKEWENIYLNEISTTNNCYLGRTQNPAPISAWIRQGDIQSNQFDVPEYNQATFLQSLDSIKTIMAEHPEDFFQQLQTTCLKAGVIVVYTPQLPKAPISSASRWIENTPIIQLSARYKQNDKFWFAFFHEAGHIITHGKTYTSIKNVNYTERDYQKEKEGHAFAEKWTFSKKQELEVRLHGALSTEDIIAYSIKFNTHPALIIGRFHHKRLIPFHVGRQFIVPIDLDKDDLA